MELVNWDSEFEIGHKELDEQHKKLIGLLNNIIEDCNRNNSSKLIADTLEQMLEYSFIHFKTEEKLLLEAGIPNFEEHKKQHKDFVKKISELCFSSINNNYTIADEITVHLKKWVVEHILVSDMELKDYCSKIVNSKN